MRSRVRPFLLGAVSCLAFLVGIAGWSPSSQADVTPPACTSVGPKLTDYSATLTLPKFDPALGTLQTVTLSGSSAMQARIRIENTSATEDTVGADIVYDSELVLPGGQSLPSALSYGHTQLVPEFDGTVDFAGSGFDTGDILKSADLTPVVLQGSDVDLYVGPGTFDSNFGATGKTSGFGSGNQVNRIVIEGKATVCVSYTYAPVATSTTSTSTSTTARVTTSTSSTSTSAPASSTTTSEVCSTTTTSVVATSTAPPRSTTTVAGCQATATTTPPIPASTTTAPATSTSSSTTSPATTTSSATSTSPVASTTAAPSSTTPDTAVLDVSTPPTTARTPAVPVSSKPTTPFTGKLPTTGSDVVATLLIGIGLLGIGASLLGLRRGVSSPACEP